jgi:hypothetical protein
MPTQVKARAPQDEREERAVHKLACSHHAPADWIWHARMVVESWVGKTPDQIAADLQPAVSSPDGAPTRGAFQPERHRWTGGSTGFRA